VRGKAVAQRTQGPFRTVTVLGGLFFTTALSLLAAEASYPSYASVKPILDQQPERLPAELKNADEAKWLAWSRREDKAIRGRLQQGDLDSLVNLLLLGTSFTGQPRIRMEGLAEASKAGILRARVDDLVAGLRNPGDSERLIFLQRVLRSQGIDPAASDHRATGAFLYNNLLRVVQERKTLEERATDAQGNAQSSLFRDRGLSLDTGIFPDFSIEQSLRDLKNRGLLPEGKVARVAVIGPGLEFIDKSEDSAYDYYPQQTLQPFLLYDSLVRLRLAKANALSISILDISPRVIQHIQHARERARKNIGYVVQLPRAVARPWPPELVAYWSSIGDQVGTAVMPIRPPGIFPGLETRAARIHPDVVRACEPVDLNIVLERLNLAAANRFDLIVGTNVFIYYDVFEQALALENAGAMLKRGGLLLTNDHLPVAPGSSMRLAGITVVPYKSPSVSAREGVGWYQKE
jgi:hypothetical protein